MLSLLALASLLYTLQISVAILDPSPTIGRTITLNRRRPPVRRVEDWGLWAKKEREVLNVKYGGSPLSRRNKGTNLLINQDSDGSYIGSLAIGTPPTPYYVVLDTGSSDLWVLDISCDSGCSGNAHDLSSSSTLQNFSQPFSVTYGIGNAAGTLVSDVVEMAGFSVKNQSFGAVTQESQGLLSSPVSGLLGLAWQSISTSGLPPFWETLASKGAWSEPVMSFQLTRFINDSTASSLEPGGSFTMGFVNSSLYTGSIDYQNLVATPSWWVLSLTSLTVQGQSVSLPSGSASYAAIDTGTTLVGGPPDMIQKIYAQIPGSQPGSGDWQDYWVYPCNTTVDIAMSFGGPSWPVSSVDFRITNVSSDQCVGAFFAINTDNKTPVWIVGDTFLKNVYSVFRYNPASVGFAALSATALAMNGVNEQVPSATVDPVSTSVTATPGNITSGAPLTSGLMFNPFVIACGVSAGVMLL